MGSLNNTSLIDHKVISEKYFFPRRESFANPFRISTPGGDLACHFTRDHPNGMTLLHFHGNGETVSDWTGDFVSLIGSWGYNVLLAEYRGYGMSDGTPSFGAILEDIPRIMDGAGLKPSRTVLFGRSVGSVPAIRGVSLYPDMAGLVLESGIADVLERLLVRLHPSELGVKREDIESAISESMDHRKALEGYRGPVLVLHAKNDSLVNINHGERLYGWSGGKKILKTFERGDHNDILYVNAREYFSVLGGFLNSLKGSISFR
ncbi:MAG TPA: alpha/beta hydrolase [Synergistetes bacterium]|nr:alpha/beta hydrolase [Synergistota bacterium]